MTKHQGTRRKRESRRGVKLLYRGDRGQWVARWKNPLSGKFEQQSLDSFGLTTKASREDWCAKKAKELAELRGAIAAGGAVEAQEPLQDAIDTFLDTRTNPRTRAAYGWALDELRWRLERRGVRLVQDVTMHHCAAWRDDIVATKGAPTSKNLKLTGAKVFLNWSRRRGWLPRLTGDAIKDSLHPVKIPVEQPDILTAEECQALLQAALRSDADDGKSGRRRRHGPRYPATAPIVLAALLTGCRRNELSLLEWSHLDLKGRRINLPAKVAKGDRARVVSLDECPLLVELLAALSLRRKGTRVFPEFNRSTMTSAPRRLERFGAPRWRWHMLRATCCSVLVNAPAIYGAGAPFRAAKRTGHSLTIAEKRYFGIIEIPANATTIEAGLGIEDLGAKIVARSGGLVQDDHEQTAVAQ